MRFPTILAIAIACALNATAAIAEKPVRAIGADDLHAVLDREKGSIVVVNLWATWCAPCLTEIPDLVRVTHELSGQGVKLIGISVDEPRASTDFVAAMRDKRFPEFVTYARNHEEMDYLVSVIDPAWNEVVPTTYVVGRDGSVKKRIQGAKSADDFRAEILSAD